MAKSKQSNNQPRTALVMPKEVFKTKLVEQITKGSQLSSTNIETEDQLVELEKQYDFWNEYNKELLKNSFNKASNEYLYYYNGTGSMIGVEDVMRGASIHNPNHKLSTLKQRIQAKTNELESILHKLDLLLSTGETQSSNTDNITMHSTNPVVFIIHGHDEEMKRSVQLFLNRAGLQDIVLHERPDKNRTIIEKLIEEGESASYVIALLSPDDIQEDGAVRARQNVILEIGYFIGKLGRKNVRLLRRGDTVIPSDLAGILYENYDSEGAWRVKLAREIKAVGLPIDIERIIASF